MSTVGSSRRGLRRWLSVVTGNMARAAGYVEPDPAHMPHPDQRFGRLTYAQHGDDLIVLAVFDAMGIDCPSYLDVGAHHPYNISNTALLYARGSRGVNIEANPNLYQAFLTSRPEDTNLNVGVSPCASAPMTFYMIDKWSGRNTFDKQVAEDFVLAHPQFSITETMEVPVMTINDIVDRHCSGRFPDFLSIDVEGLDESIIRSIDFERGAPKVICAEVVTGGGGARNEAGLKQYLAGQGYFPLIRCGGNTVFVRNEYREQVT